MERVLSKHRAKLKFCEEETLTDLIVRVWGEPRKADKRSASHIMDIEANSRKNLGKSKKLKH